METTEINSGRSFYSLLFMLAIKFRCIKRGHKSAQKLIARGNHSEILFAIRHHFFLKNGKIFGSAELLDRGNHKEIMSFLGNMKGFGLNRAVFEKLIARGHHEEIMCALQNDCVLQKEKIFVFSDVLKRGNHNEIVTFLCKLVGLKLPDIICYKLLERNDQEEILIAVRNRCFAKSKDISGLDEMVYQNRFDEIITALKQAYASAREDLYQLPEDDFARILVAHENHDEIMQAIKNDCFSQGKTIYGFNEVIDRGNHEEIMAFLDYPKGIHLDEPSTQKLIARGNHDEIMQAIKNDCFSQGETIYGFNEVIDRGKHKEIMAFLNYPSGIHLGESTVPRLIARGNHKEIMLAIKNACFSRKDGTIYGLNEVIDRGNHEEILAFLDYPKGIRLSETARKKLINRGDEQEINFAREHGCI